MSKQPTQLEKKTVKKIYTVFCNGKSYFQAFQRTFPANSDLFNRVEEAIYEKYPGKGQVERINHAGRTISLNYL